MSKKNTQPAKQATQANVSVKPLAPKASVKVPQPGFQVKPVAPGRVAAIVLEELSRDYGDVCNYLEAAQLAREGNLYLAHLSVKQHNDSIIKGSTCSMTPRQVWVLAQADGAVKKLVDPEFDRWPATRSLWFSTEERCRKVNRKFELLHKRRLEGNKTLPYARELYRFYEAVHFILGDTPPLEDICMEAHYGPGSTVSIRGREVHYARKLEALDCVPTAVELAAQALVHDKAMWPRLGFDPTYSNGEAAQEGFIRVAREQILAHSVRSDRLMFIHKGMTSLRSIGAQPTLSGMLQLGVHSIGSQLLKKAGIDLADQGKNQALARKGSLDWQSVDPLCTLDKSNASNTLAKGLIQFFFPPAWSKLLLRLRTPAYVAPEQLGGEEHTYHMYAGMGNGSTFFVETLVFWAATYATSDASTPEEYVEEDQFAVYGDDVILRRSHAKRYMPFARFLGFSFNMSKSFTEGPFRESCGADYYAGVNVRPAILDCENQSVSMETLIGFHNTLADHRTFPLKGACAKLRNLWKQSMYPIVPTDPAGDLGFRPVDVPYYDIVRDKSNAPLISPVWFRPRTYVLMVKPKYAELAAMDHWTQYAVSLLRARQEHVRQGTWSLPFRKLTTVKVIAERDLEKKDLVQMLANSLVCLADRKQMPWWNSFRGITG